MQNTHKAIHDGPLIDVHLPNHKGGRARVPAYAYRRCTTRSKAGADAVVYMPLRGVLTS